MNVTDKQTLLNCVNKTLSDPNDRQEFKKFIDQLIADGYELAIKKNSQAILQNSDKGISYRICMYSSYFYTSLFLKTSRGGYELWSSVWNIKNIDSLLNKSSTYICPTQEKRLTKIANLPKPFEFIDSDEIVFDGEFICKNGMISQCKVVNMVTINDDVSLNDEIAVPKDKDVWYHLDCRNAVHATFDIISDGETWYPIRRYGIKKISTNLKPKASIDLSKMDTSDKNIINKAISHFIGGTTKSA